jgi:glycosyltransferase involved in cell wall biosynthesis
VRPDLEHALRGPRAGEEQHLVVVLPAYNEADSIAFVLDEVAEAAGRLRLTGVRTSCIVVDDNSPDGTGEVAAAAADRLGLPLRIVTGERNGLGDAMLRGLAAALELDPTAVATLDGDGQHNPADLPMLFRAARARHADITIGSRWARGGRAPGTSVGRAAGSRLGNWMFRAVSGTRGVKDATTSYRIYSPAVLRFLLDSESRRYGGYSFFSTTIGLAEAAGFTITEVPIVFRPRYSGLSKLNRREVWRYFASLGSLRQERRKLVATNDDGTPYRASDEILLLARARRWNRFVVDAVLDGNETPGTILEVGAGHGGITAAVRERFPSSRVIAVEPDADNFAELAAAFADDPMVTVFPGTLADLLAAQPSVEADVTMYVNVLEHIDDDAAELKAAHDVTAPGGRLAVFVPALPAIYGPIDAKSGHYRRYTTALLRDTVAGAGFVVDRLEFAERLGVIPYWVSYRLLNRSTIPGGTIAVFDNLYVPAMQMAERALKAAPIGKNLVCIARRAPTP